MTIDTADIRRRLEEERDAVAVELERVRDQHRRSLDDEIDEDGVDSHLADSATETHDREVEMGLEESLEHRSREIDAALERIAEGRYGICDGCGERIAPDRLEALPYATKCIDCKRLEERS